ncbi:MAG: GNAT family N-acetyltransferase [Bacteroidetes bacterium]|nr:GNAT family N-acetyltransferase [Bacteroidota bacterium]
MDQSSPISFRDAVPQDVEAAVPLIYSSGPVAFDYIFSVEGKGSAKDFLSYCFVRPGGEMGHADHTVAVAGNSIVGIGKTYSADINFKNTRSIAWRIISFYGLLKGLGVIRRGLQFEDMIKPPAKGESTIVHIGVDPAAQGKGIGRGMMEALINKAEKKGSATAVLDVAEENDRARFLYERLGFKITGHIPCELKREDQPESVPGHYRMELSLGKD